MKTLSSSQYRDAVLTTVAIRGYEIDAHMEARVADHIEDMREAKIPVTVDEAAAATMKWLDKQIARQVKQN